MRKIVLSIALMVTVFGGVAVQASAERGTAAEAEAMVDKVVAYYKSHGREKMLQEVNNSKGQFVDRDMYVVIQDMQGNWLAHGINPRVIGKSAIDVRDADGKLFIQERLEIAKARGKAWHDYKWFDPLTKTIQAKTAYFVRVEDMVISCGIYKP